MINYVVRFSMHPWLISLELDTHMSLLILLASILFCIFVLKFISDSRIVFSYVYLVSESKLHFLIR